MRDNIWWFLSSAPSLSHLYPGPAWILHMSINSFSISAQFTAQIAKDSCSGAQIISIPIPSSFSSSDLGVPSIVLQSFVTSSSSLCPGILPFPKCFLIDTTSFPAGLSCAVQRVWHKADAALLPQRSPLQPPLPATACLHSTQFLTREGGKIKIQWLVLKFENQQYILSLLIMYTKCSHQSKFQLPMSQCFHPQLATTCTTDLKPLQNLKNRKHILWKTKSKMKICLWNWIQIPL